MKVTLAAPGGPQRTGRHLGGLSPKGLLCASPFTTELVMGFFDGGPFTMELVKGFLDGAFAAFLWGSALHRTGALVDTAKVLTR